MEMVKANEVLVRRRWWIATLLLVAGLINYLDRTVVSVAGPVIAKDLGLTPSRMGLLLSAFFWSYALMQIPIGWLADRFNLRWMYAGCFALWSLTSGLTGFAGSLGMLLVLRVLLGIGESVYLPGGLKLVSIMFRAEDRGLASGLINSGTRAGLAFGAPLIAGLVVAVGWHRAFFVLGFAGLAWLGPWFGVFPKGVDTRERTSLETRRKPGGLPHINRNLMGVALSNVGYGYYFYLMVTWLPSYLVDARHLPLRTAGAYALFPFLTFAIGEPLGGFIADRLVARGWSELTARKTMITAAYLTSLLLIPAELVADTHRTVLFLGGASLVGLSTANMYALVQRVSVGGQVGFATGVFNLAGNIPGVLAPLITGIIVERTGSYLPAFVVAVAVLIAAVPVYWTMVREG
jgi:MFS family permease